MKKDLLLYVVLAALHVVLLYLLNVTLVSDAAILQSFAKGLSPEQTDALMQDAATWGWLGYALVPVMLLLKISLVAFCLSVGYMYFSNTLEYKKFFAVALYAEFIFLLPVLIKLIWFNLVKTDFNIVDVQTFYPLSIAGFFAPNELEPYQVYSLQIVNLFELAYIVVLALNLKEQLSLTFNFSFKTIILSYVPALAFWVVFVTFITLAFVPAV